MQVIILYKGGAGAVEIPDALFDMVVDQPKSADHIPLFIGREAIPAMVAAGIEFKFRWPATKEGE